LVHIPAIGSYDEPDILGIATGFEVTPKDRD
jgi:hypothetical protein